MTPRAPRLLDPGYLAFLRTKPCCVCGSHANVEAAHIRIGLTGMARKPDDAKATPLCAWHHRESPQAQHNMGEADFWERHDLNPFAIAEKLYGEYGGTGGKPRAARKIKPRPPREKRQKIRSRGFPRAHPKPRS